MHPLTLLPLALPLALAQSQPWNDEVIGEPHSFKATQVAPCTYQLAYIRDYGDGRYIKSFVAAHGSSTRSVPGVNSANGFLYFAEYVEDLNVFHVTDACSGGASGAEPDSFKILFRLDDGYTYTNDWDTDAFAPSAGPVPSVPANVRAVRSGSRTVQVSWAPVDGASGYLIKSEGLVDSEVGDVDYQTSDSVQGGSSTGGVANGGRIQKVAVLAVGQDQRVISDFTQTPIVNVEG